MPGFARAVMIASATAFLGGWLAPDASAQTITVEQYQHPKGEKDLNSNKPYLEGIKDGLIAYNMSVEDRLFCLGEGLPVLTFERANDTLLQWARKRRGDAGGLPLGLGLLYSLKEAFPCKGTPR
jgi:lipopolysaccharide export LptBFGC system permease protein LptF